MRSFDQFLAVLNEIPDPRRAEGKLYMLPYLLLFLGTRLCGRNPRHAFLRDSRIGD